MLLLLPLPPPPLPPPHLFEPNESKDIKKDPYLTTFSRSAGADFIVKPARFWWDLRSWVRESIFLRSHHLLYIMMHDVSKTSIFAAESCFLVVFRALMRGSPRCNERIQTTFDDLKTRIFAAEKMLFGSILRSNERITTMKWALSNYAWCYQKQAFLLLKKMLFGGILRSNERITSMKWTISSDAVGYVANHLNLRWLATYPTLLKSAHLNSLL